MRLFRVDFEVFDKRFLVTDGSNQNIWTPTSDLVSNLNADKVDGYDLNQSVETTSSPTFAEVTVTAGATGTFTTVDGKTVTVTSGIITSII